MGYQAIFVPSACIAVATPLKPIPRCHKGSGKSEMLGFFAPLRMTDTLTHPCRDATRAGMVGGFDESCVFFEFYCAGLGSAFFAMVVGLGFQKVGSALIHSSAG